MSYILDALKRADDERERERERGAVPGLQSRHATTPAAKADRRAPRRIWLAVAALALGGIAAGLWFWQTPSGTGQLAAVAPAVPPPAQPVPPPTLPVPASPPAVTAPRVAASLPPAVVRAAPKPVPKPAPAASAAAVQPPPGPRPDPVAKSTASQTAPPAVRSFNDLPEGMRRQIPPLVITGSVYSKNPDKRLLLVNNQVIAQGTLAAPEVTLEEIQAKSSVFSYQGTRFRLAH